MNEPKEKSSTEAPLHHIGLERPIRLKNHRSTTIIVTDNEEVTRRPLTYTDLFEPTIPQAKDAEDDCLTPRTEDDEEVGARRESSNVTKFSTGVALPKFTEMPKLRSWKSIQNGGETDYGGSVSGEKPSSPVSKMPEFNKSISQTDKPPECPKPAWMSQTKLRRVTPASQIEKNATNSTEEVSTESDRITVEENCGSDFGRKGILATSPFLQGGKRKTWSQSGSKTLDTCRDDPTGVNKPRSQPGAEGPQKVNLPPVTEVNPAERTAPASEQKPTSPEPKDEPEITIIKDRKRSSSSSSSSSSKLDGKATAESIAGAQTTHLPPVADANLPERKAATSEQTSYSSAARNLPEINDTDERKRSSSSSSSTTSSASSSAHMKAFVGNTPSSSTQSAPREQTRPKLLEHSQRPTSTTKDESIKRWSAGPEETPLRSEQPPTGGTVPAKRLTSSREDSPMVTQFIEVGESRESCSLKKVSANPMSPSASENKDKSLPDASEKERPSLPSGNVTRPEIGNQSISTTSTKLDSDRLAQETSSPESEPQESSEAGSDSSEDDHVTDFCKLDCKGLEFSEESDKQPGSKPKVILAVAANVVTPERGHRMSSLLHKMKHKKPDGSTKDPKELSALKELDSKKIPIASSVDNRPANTDSLESRQKTRTWLHGRPKKQSQNNDVKVKIGDPKKNETSTDGCSSESGSENENEKKTSRKFRRPDRKIPL